MPVRPAVRAFTIAAFICALTTAAPAAEGPAAVVGVEPAQDRDLSGEWEGQVHREMRANFGFGPINYAIRQTYRYHKDDPGKVEVGEGYIGMPAPCSCNWYHGGFLFIRVNGRDVPIPASSMMAVESGERAIMDLVYHHEAANVRARFFGLPGEDWLGCEVTIDPTAEITQLDVTMRCYPSFFTAARGRDGARRIQTSSMLVEQGETREGPLPENWWAFYYDEIFDVEKGEGEGPCAMLVEPVEGATVTFSPGSYAVGTSITFPPATRTLRFAFWDLKGSTNADALESVRGRAQQVLETLKQTDLTPKAVAEFDVAGVRESLETALASEEAREALGDRIDEIQRWINESAPQLEQAGGAPGVAAQEELLKSIDEYNSFKWEVKLIELIYDL